jgi:hypothetical protein
MATAPQLSDSSTVRQGDPSVQLESHATPPQESLQQRYATLHRAIERGLDSDEVWRELADISLRIGHTDEAVRCSRHIRNATTRLALESRLTRLGLATTPVAPANHAAAPAASDAGPAAEREGEHLSSHAIDALQYLFHQHMPWLVLLTTLAFPLLVGLGGMLTAGGSPLILAAIAAVPGLCVLGLAGAMNRQILLVSSEGCPDAPAVPCFSLLVADARRWFTDAALVLGSLVGPSLAGVWFHAPWHATVPGLVCGAFFVPMAWALRHVRGDFAALSPVHLVRAIARTSPSYLGLTAIVTALMLPAAITAWLVTGRPVWVQIAALGPLFVLPSFVASRLLGTWIDVHRQALGRTAAAAPEAPVVAASHTSAAAAPTPRRPLRPKALEQFRAPSLKSAKTAPSPRPGATKVKPAASGRRTADLAPAHPATSAQPPTPRAIEGRKPVRLTDAPDLSHMPGATVVSGQQRETLGAASRRQ